MVESPLQAKLRELDKAQYTLSREEFARKIETELAPLYEAELRAHGAHEPDWAPLRKIIPANWRDGFGFMGYEGKIRIYKQGFTRRCLYVDPEGNTYQRIGYGFQKIAVKLAVEDVFAGIEEYGFSRSTPYTKKNAAKRRRKVEKESGYKIISIGGPNH